ncbi:hypothetical protein BDY19DRAFT_998871 [Irpex rosettiformis]|uniref:Uncharacterized protein n=1 Tax=Irpex rosettiformis TaxID=378272 RepID=A0ACB8TM75_9APHY|nr:hypothetical protein BDY19DRAFT_998871 [Irpex rosettiformis]
MSNEQAKRPSSYKVESDDPRVYTGIEPFEIEGRNLALPPLFRYVDGTHPQLRNEGHQARIGTVYVYLVDASTDGRAAFHALSSTMRIPSGRIDQAGGNPELQGLLVLNEGDALFARDIRAGGKVEEDILQILVATRYNSEFFVSFYVNSPSRDTDDVISVKRQSLLACRDKILGPRDTRDGRRVWFEQQNRAKSIGKEETRCYGLSNMLERPMNASGPPAALKVIQ